jgi:biotin synthase
MSDRSVLRDSSLSETSLSGAPFSRSLCREVLSWNERDLMSLVQQAYIVRRHYFGNRVHVQMLRNAKSGMCSEDCHYCAQSRVSQAHFDRYPLLSVDVLLREARKAATIKASRFCMATAGARPNDREIEELCDTISAIKKETGLPLCASVGLLSAQQAARLKAAGLDRVNHNLNTSRGYYPRICTTHTYQDRVDTVNVCRDAGLEICSGGIVGQGESDDDVIDMLLALCDLRPEAIPINFLIPVEGTPFGSAVTGLNPRRCLKILCLARLLNPKTEIRAAGGWEHHMRSLKPLALYAADSIFVSGYLTTGGTSVKEVSDMIADLGFESTIEDAQV